MAEETTLCNDDSASEADVKDMKSTRRSVMAGLGASSALLFGGIGRGSTGAMSADGDTDLPISADYFQLLLRNAEIEEESKNKVRIRVTYGTEEVVVRAFKNKGNSRKAGQIEVLTDQKGEISAAQSWEEVVTRYRIFLTKEGKLWYAGASVELTDNANTLGKLAIGGVIVGIAALIPTAGASGALLAASTFILAGIILEFGSLKRFTFGVLDHHLFGLPFNTAVIKSGYTTNRSGTIPVTFPEAGYFRN